MFGLDLKVAEWWAIGIAALLLIATFCGLVGAVHYYRSELLVVQAQYDGFKQTVDAQGKAAKAEADATIAKSKLETANVQTTLATTLADNKRLQSDASRARASRGYLPTLPAGSGNAASTACFDRPKLDAALRAFGTGVAGIVAEGADAFVYRDGWHKWYDGQIDGWSKSAQGK